VAANAIKRRPEGWTPLTKTICLVWCQRTDVKDETYSEQNNRGERSKNEVKPEGKRGGEARVPELRSVYL